MILTRYRILSVSSFSFVPLLLFAVLSSPFPHEAHLKFHLIWWKMCYHADMLRKLRVHRGVCVCCVRAPLSARAYTSSPSPVTTSPSAGPARAGPSGVSLLNEISAPLTRALVLSPFCQENRNDLWPPDLWAATVFLQVGDPSTAADRA